MRFIFVITVLFLHPMRVGGGGEGVCVRICLCMNWGGGGSGLKVCVSEGT